MDIHLPIVLLTLIAQGEALSGVGSGWAGAGLLGGVLAWLLFIHLPNKDKQIIDLLTTKDKQITELAAVFKSEATAERMACERHFETLATSINTALSTLGKQLSEHSQRNQAWITLLQKEVEEKKALVTAETERLASERMSRVG